MFMHIAKQLIEQIHQLKFARFLKYGCFQCQGKEREKKGENKIEARKRDKSKGREKYWKMLKKIEKVL